MMMNWQDILTIIVPLGGFLAWIYSRIDKRFDGIDKRFDENKNEFKEIRNELNSLNTRVAVIESKILDISTNVSHLMWHHQSLPQKEVKEE